MDEFDPSGGLGDGGSVKGSAGCIAGIWATRSKDSLTRQERWVQGDMEQMAAMLQLSSGRLKDLQKVSRTIISGKGASCHSSWKLLQVNTGSV